MKDVCKNCGGWEGIHQYETNRCPRYGLETYTQDWQNTTFEPQDDEVSILRLEVELLRQAIDNLIERLEEYETKVDNHLYSMNNPHDF